MGQGKSTNSGKLTFNFEIFKNSFFSYLNIKRIIVIEVLYLYFMSSNGFLETTITGHCQVKMLLFFS
jgi:hypothetical protein